MVGITQNITGTFHYFFSSLNISPLYSINKSKLICSKETLYPQVQADKTHTKPEFFSCFTKD